MEWLPECRKAVNTWRAHFNIIVNPMDIDHITERVRPANTNDSNEEIYWEANETTHTRS